MKIRLVTGISAGAAFVLFVLLGRLPFTLLIYLIGSISLYELLRMKRVKLLSTPGIISLLTLWTLLLPSVYEPMEIIKLTKVEAVLFGVLVLLAYTVLTKNTFSFDEAAFVILSTLYLGMGFYCFIEIRNFSGIEMIFYAIGVIWATDSGAYFIGKSLGKRKLWPEISPNKTVGGFMGGIIVSVVFAFVYQTITSFTDSYILILFTTVFLSIFGQIGDLVESALKRHYQVKDSGHILPGHGGMVDRFDSFLFVMPLMFFFLRFF